MTWNCSRWTKIDLNIIFNVIRNNSNKISLHFYPPHSIGSYSWGPHWQCFVEKRHKRAWLSTWMPLQALGHLWRIPRKHKHIFWWGEICIKIDFFQIFFWKFFGFPLKTNKKLLYNTYFIITSIVFIVTVLYNPFLVYTSFGSEINLVSNDHKRKEFGGMKPELLEIEPYGVI